MPSKTGLIIPLDVDTREEALRIVDQCGNVPGYKVGFQLFTRTGPDFVRELKNSGHFVFLDLKLHDIPNTVQYGAASAADLGADLTTVHALGGKKMIAAARMAVEGTPTRILAVTILTSHSDEVLKSDLGLDETAAQAVPRLAGLAVEAGAHGLVASPVEIGLIREKVGAKPIIVTPGVRPSWAGADDQARVLTPAEAARAGSDYVVIGRPIIKHPNPAKAVQLILEELSE